MEIKKPRSKPILVSTWYRPPDSPVSHLTEFERMIGSFDAENLEYYLLGDLNVDFMSTSESSNRQKVKEILDIYEIEQLINGIFPYEWKASRLTPIFKSGTKSDPGNYRPISVIPCVATIFEKIIFDQLYWYLGGNSLL